MSHGCCFGSSADRCEHRRVSALHALHEEFEDASKWPEYEEGENMLYRSGKLKVFCSPSWTNLTTVNEICASAVKKCASGLGVFWMAGKCSGHANCEVSMMR